MKRARRSLRALTPCHVPLVSGRQSTLCPCFPKSRRSSKVSLRLWEMCLSPGAALPGLLSRGILPSFPLAALLRRPAAGCREPRGHEETKVVKLLVNEASMDDAKVLPDLSIPCHACGNQRLEAHALPQRGRDLLRMAKSLSARGCWAPGKVFPGEEGGLITGSRAVCRAAVPGRALGKAATGEFLWACDPGWA